MQQTRIKDDAAEKVIPPSSIFDESSVSSPDARKQAAPAAPQAFSTIGQVHGRKTMAQAGGMGSAGGADVQLTNLSRC